MTKNDLVNFMAEETGLSKADATRAVDAFMKGIVEGLNKEGKVALTGFLTFVKKYKPESKARNPRTGEDVVVAARNAVTIKAGAKLKDALN